MDLRFFLVFLVFFLPVFPLFGQEHSTCLKEFECRNLTSLEFPFSNNTFPDCGLHHLNCTHSPPTIKLDLFPWSEGFEVRNMSESYVIKLHDPIFSTLQIYGICHFLKYYHRPLQNSSISFTTDNVTLLRCSKISLPRTDVYRRLESCWDFNIYYAVPQYIGPPIPPPLDCFEVQLPVHRPVNKELNKNNLFDFLTADFDLHWHVSDGVERRNEKYLGVIIGTSVPGGVLLIVLAIVLILYKKGNGISFHPRNSTERSSKLDLEGGSAIYFGLPVFSYGELEEITNNFDVSKELGSGGFGVVYYGKLRDGREVAVKRLFEHNFKRITQFLNEVEILTRLRHPNLVSLYGCTSRRCRELLLVYEYIPNGTLADHLHGDRANDQLLTWSVRMNIAIQTAGALAYLHASDIIHRDVKTCNILLGHNFQVKVADFGLSRLFPDDVSHISTAPQGTPGYVDPEYRKCYQLTDKSDVYSFGVVLIELISSLPAVDISRNRQEIKLANLAINKIQRHAFNELIDPSLGFDSDPEITRMTISVAELASQCLQVEKELRPTMDEVLETLKAIQDCNEDFIEMSKVAGENNAELNDVALLKKNIKFLSLPNPETDLLARDSTKTS